MQPTNQAIRKRSQIASTNKMMFIWVACVSAVFGIASVVTVFLIQVMLFNDRVIGEKERTVATLKSNIASIDELEKNVRLLDNNEALKSIKSNPDDQAIQVILDALPAKANSLALGASIQNRLLVGVEGLTLEKLSIDPVVGIESLTGGEAVVDESESSIQNEITLRLTVVGTDNDIKKFLVNIEKSIRVIDILTLKIEKQNNLFSMTLSGRAFYEPELTVGLKDKVIK